MPRYVMEAYVVEIDDSGDEVGIVKVESPQWATPDKDELIWMARCSVAVADLYLEQRKGSTPYYPSLKS